MRRREFLRKSMGAGIAAGAVYTIGGYNKIWGNTIQTNKIDLVAVKGGGPDAMFDKGISALGGMTNFVKSGQTVVINQIF